MLPSCALANIVENHKLCPQSIDVHPPEELRPCKRRSGQMLGLSSSSAPSWHPPPGMLGASLPDLLPGNLGHISTQHCSANACSSEKHPNCTAPRACVKQCRGPTRVGSLASFLLYCELFQSFPITPHGD